ncbi:hypothetical protein AJ79_04574 [Helicocarpus griseus UAMH5409]|uniref:Uncharacterized protein n=1 Tax=Helicocarpus griseus UAMH5409 TaxID=1447875 RepID=A0A2B7XU22_9EURO|nr:hypothetical protein AJ79_04574 [Helicocarpus griseus UAMH5409]
MGFKETASKYVIGSNRGQDGEGAKAAGGVNGSGSGSEHVESVEKVPQGRGKRLLAHYKRWWICYLIGIIIFLAIFLPVFFTVAIPAIAQRMVDDAELPIHGGMIMKPTPDSVEYSLTASLAVPKPFTVELEPIVLHLYRVQQTPEEAYIDVPLPEMKLKGNAMIDVPATRVPVLDMADWTQFLTEAVHQEKFILAAKGSTTAHLGALKVELTLDKQLELNGLNKLKGYDILSAKLILPFQEDGTNLKATLNIPNHSIITFELGDLTLDMFSGDIWLGQAVIYEAKLTPGDNIVNADIRLDLQRTVSNIKPVLESQGDALRRGNLKLRANGNTTIFDGQHIPFYEDVLNNLNVEAEVPIMKVLTDSIAGLTEGGKGLKGILDMVKQGGLKDIMGIVGDLFKGDGLKNIMDALGGVIKSIIGGEGGSLKEILDGIDLPQLLKDVDLPKILGGLDIKKIVGDLDIKKIVGDLDLKNLLKDVKIQDVASTIKSLNLGEFDLGGFNIKQILEDANIKEVLANLNKPPA